jgi:hypothetical protein
MDTLELSEVLALILAAGGPRDQLARVRWPLHLALHEAFEATGRSGERRELGFTVEFRASADVGHQAIGVDQAFDKLVACGVLRPHGEKREARLQLDPVAAVDLRRKLMTFPAHQVALFQRAGARWAALADTAAKNRSTAPRSSGSTVASSTPNREKRAVADGA